MKKVLIISIFIILFGCKKEKKDNNNNTSNNPPTVTTCFKNEEQGTYNGDGTENNVPFFSSNVTITKLSCTSIKIDTPSNSYTINSLNASSASNYAGTANNSESAAISFTVNGTQYTVSINIANTLQFNGSK